MQEIQKANVGLDRTQAETFTSMLNIQPPDVEIKINKAAGNSKYLPVSFVEMKLDEVFAGLWQTRNFTTRVITNEIVGEIELGVYHPVAQEWVWRVGAGAVMIQQKSGSSIDDVTAKIKNTLVKDYPHLKAECMKNAARSLGKMFGRDLNRDLEDSYTPFSNEMEVLASNIDQAKAEVAAASTKDEMRALWVKYSKLPGMASTIRERIKAIENA